MLLELAFVRNVLGMNWCKLGATVTEIDNPPFYAGFGNVQTVQI
jgi:hypothetical protein